MRRVIVCADGTWNKPDQKDRGKRKPTNVVKLARAIYPVDSRGISQLTSYDLGVGTHNWWDKFVGGAFGRGLSEKIVEAYQFIVGNYAAGDELFLFGFSRGAYTVRSLSGLIDLIGLLPKDEVFYMREAYDLYRSAADPDVITKFRADHRCRPVTIRFLGVWDTVGALGIPIGIFEGFNSRYQFHDVELAGCVQNAYQALAIDERRKPFVPTLWDSALNPDQTMRQLWFAGVHTNIGGGYEKDGLANIALHWIINKAKALGLEVDERFLAHYKPWHMDELRNSRKGKYRLQRPYVRAIGETEYGNEAVHGSAIERMNASPPPPQGAYTPENLKVFLDNGGMVVKED